MVQEKYIRMPISKSIMQGYALKRSDFYMEKFALNSKTLFID